MRDSSTYQAILREGKAEGLAEGRAEGRVEEARRMLLLLGNDDFGSPASKIEARVEAMTDIEQIEEIIKRLRVVSTWEELFDES